MKSVCIKLEWDEVENDIVAKDVIDGLKMFVGHVFIVTRIDKTEEVVNNPPLNKE